MAEELIPNPLETLQLPTQSKKNQDLSRFIFRRFNDMKSNRRRNGDDMWDTFDRLIRNEPSSEPEEDWQANVFVPFIMSVQLAILAEITARRSRWKTLPINSASEKKAEVIDAIVDATMAKGRWDEESFKRDQDKLTYGTAVWKEIYREDRRVIRIPKYDKEGTLIDITTKDIREFNDVYGKHIPIRNFYLDDKAVDLREARDCMERNIFNINDFKTRYSKYKNAKKVKQWGFIKPTIPESAIQNLPPGGNTTQEGAYIPVSALRKDDVEVFEYWNKPKDMHVVMANGIIVVEEPIPYWHKQLPYAMDVCIPLPNSAYGMGIPRILEATNEELNTIHNMMIDEGKLSIHKPILVGGMTILDEDEYQVRPGGLIPVDDVNQAREMPNSGLAASHFQLFEEVKQTGRTAAGMDVRFAEASTAGTGTDTATEVLRLQESSLRRIGLISKMLDIRCMPRIAMLRTANIQQFYQDPLRVDMVVANSQTLIMNEETGEVQEKQIYRTIRQQPEGKSSYNFLEIKPEDVRGQFDTEVISQATQELSQAVIAKRLNTALQTIMAFPPALQIVDITELFKHYFKAIDLPTAIVRDVLNEDQEADFMLAEQENGDMSQGKEVPPTPNASVKHTAVHLAYMYVLDQNGEPTGEITPHFQQLNEKEKRIFLKHIQGEKDQHALKGNVSADGVARTPGAQTGMGTQQAVPGQEVPSQQMGATQ